MTSPSDNNPSPTANKDAATVGAETQGAAKSLNAGTPAGHKSAQPDWANGLRELYDSVVEEPLPDSFNDLLSQLDDRG